MNNLATFGYELHAQVFTSGDIEAMLTWIPSLEGAAGTRNLLEIPQCRELARDTRITKLVEDDLGPNSIPIRAILFDKSAAANWNLGWHQDKKIAVKRHIETDGFSAWSEKEGVIHCQPPATILEASLAVR
ncbi:MAG: phytanoyl-CoA dioxygenase, partial [Fimbriimonadaceae bacterium]